MKSLITVIIPTYNREDKILRAIKSVLAQTYENVEILVIDDSSQDNTKEIVTNFIEQKKLHNIVTYIKNKNNLGSPATRNVGIKIAKGEYIAFLDDDDFFFPDKLEKQIQYLLKNNGKVCSCGMLNIEGDRILRSSPFTKNNKVSFENGGAIVSWLLHKSVFEEIGYFDKSFSVSDVDADFLVRLNRNFRIYFLKEYLFIHYYYPNQISSTNSRRIKGMELLIKKYKDSFNRFEMSSAYLKLAIFNVLGNKKSIKCILKSIKYNLDFKNALLLIIFLLPNRAAKFFTNKIIDFLNYSKSFAGRYR